MNKVAVLMSTYNGELYLEEQINSLLRQKNVDISILVRDDCSNDKTSKLLDKYSKEKKIKWYSGEKLKSTKSFLDLIKHSPQADYYAFCDQDDVWDDNKLNFAIKKIRKYDKIPAIYCSNTNLVDENLNYLKRENKNPRCSLYSAIIKNYATGCTMVFNKKLMLYLKRNLDVDVPYHDWWVNLVCLSIGGISFFDNNAYIKYRQHSNNVVGGNVSIINKWKKRYKKFWNLKYNRDKMARQIISIYYDKINEKNMDILNSFVNYKKNKFKIIFNKNKKTKNMIDNVLFDICVIFNKL